jgi:tetratricopeptide (TPR) repeat protein
LRALRTRWAYYLPLALTLAIIPALLLTTVALRSKTGAGLEAMTAWTNLKTQAGVIVHYIRLALWPSGLTIDYDDWPIARSLADVLPQALLVVALLALTAYGLWRGYRIAFSGAWFFLILAPTSSFLPLGTEIAGERRMYLPTVAVAALAVLGGRAALARMSRRYAWRPASARLTGALAVLVVAGALLATTVNRNDDYRDAVTIYADAAAKRPNNARAVMNLGVALDRAGRSDAARAAFAEALRRKPNYPDAHYNLGAILLQQGNADAAAPHFAAAMQGRPTWPLPYLRLGQVLQARGHAADARQMYDKARALAQRAGQTYLVAEIDAAIATLTKGEPA